MMSNEIGNNVIPIQQNKPDAEDGIQIHLILMKTSNTQLENKQERSRG